MWFNNALIACVSFAGMHLIIRKAMDLGASSKIVNIFLFGIVFLLFVSFNFLTKETIPKENLKMILVLLVIASLLSFLGNYFIFLSTGVAPNPGYSVAIVSVGAAIIAIVSYFLFNLDLSFINFLGIIAIILGAFLVAK